MHYKNNNLFADIPLAMRYTIIKVYTEVCESFETPIQLNHAIIHNTFFSFFLTVKLQ